MKGSRHKDWLAQAKADYSWGKDSLAHGHYAQTCFIAQQVTEKALKAIAYKRGFTEARGHSVLEIASELKINGPLRTSAQVLDQYYISTRYPDAMPSGNPSIYFTEEQAKDALSKAQAFIGIAEKAMEGDQ